MVLAPRLILSYYERLPEEPYFEGVLHMWHISGWRTGGSSAAAFLENRIRQFEANNPHTFIELASLTPEKASAALKQGEKPDLVSFPYGQAPALAFEPLPRQSFALPADTQYAWPYMCGGYLHYCQQRPAERKRHQCALGAGAFAPMRCWMPHSTA